MESARESRAAGVDDQPARNIRGEVNLLAVTGLRIVELHRIVCDIAIEIDIAACESNSILRNEPTPRGIVIAIAIVEQAVPSLSRPVNWNGLSLAVPVTCAAP